MHLSRVYTCSPSWTPFPPPSPYHPSGSSQCTSPKHPVSCIKPGLAIHFLYDIIHVSMLFERHRHHSGYVKQRWNTSKTIGRFRNYVAKNVCQLSDAHILTWARNAAMRNCSPWLSDACKLYLYHTKVCHTELHRVLTSTANHQWAHLTRVFQLQKELGNSASDSSCWEVFQN